MRRLILTALLCLACVAAYAQTGAPLSPGYLSVSGNQIVDGSGNNVRLACIGYGEPTSNYSSDMSIIRAAGFNCVRYPYYDVTLNLTTMDAIVTAATANNIRVIFDHHGNEADASCLGQQDNGLWYDLNAGTYTASNNTDGCGTAGTITYATFKANWVTIATHYAGNSTVIGFDLDNEPFMYGSATSPQVNWGSGNSADIKAMYNDVGNAINAVNPGALIICEGPFTNAATLLNQIPTTVTTINDLSLAGSQPVVVSNKVVYSIHNYPSDISGVTADSGATAVSAWNAAWGYLVKDGTAPVWVGEMGASLDNTNGTVADEQAWGAAMVSYLNGLDGGSGGPVFTSKQQGIGTDWWTFGYLAGQIPDGILNSDNSLKAGQKAVWSQLLYSPTSTATTTWNPNDASAGITLSGANLIATSTLTAGQGVRTTTSQTAGKSCATVTLTTTTNHAAVGVSTAAEVLTGYLGLSGSVGIGLFPDFGGQPIYANGATAASSGTASNSGNGEVVTIALDATNQLIWISDTAMAAVGQTWNDSATANPATGVGGISISFISPPYFLEANTNDSGTVFDLNPSPSGCPSGFGPWSTAIASNAAPISVILGGWYQDLLIPAGFSFSLRR